MAVYDSLARFYDQAFAPFERRFLARWRDETLAMLPHGSDIVEIGSGTGANFSLYPPSRCSVSTEFSIKMIEIAATKTVGNHLVQADGQALPFPDNSFDAAFATLVFCSIPDPHVAFREVKRIVRPGGRVVLLEHVRPEGMFGTAFDVLNVFTKAVIQDHFNRRTAEIAANAGLMIREVRVKARGAVNLIVAEVPEPTLLEANG
ncbi:MAG: methyltransferase domain-containing protein [Blastocatellia bacterium]|nr:methyltransferase domain-containing protein [Blastocatellia bacterium]